MMQGRSVDQKEELAAAVIDVLGSDETSVSVAIEYVPEGRFSLAANTVRSKSSKSTALSTTMPA